MKLLKYLLLIPLLFVPEQEVSAKIIGAFVLPHGGIALSPSQFNTPSKWAKQHAWAIHRASVEVGSYIRSLHPDVVLLSTPHGVADLRRFSFYMNGRANGSASTDNCQCPPCCYDVEVKLNVELTRTLVERLDADGCNVTGTTCFGPPGNADEATPLRWAEVIPLIFLKDVSQTKFVMLSQPSRRYKEAVAMIDELLDLGRKLYDQLEALSETVVILISADLAHTHDSSGPYGFSPAAEPFDESVGNWAATLHPTYLLETAAQYEPAAMSCGYTGLVMLHGLLDRGRLSSWVPVMHANFHPSYYGMMVASFSRQTERTATDEEIKRRMLATNRIGTTCPNCVPNNQQELFGLH